MIRTKKGLAAASACACTSHDAWDWALSVPRTRSSRNCGQGGVRQACMIGTTPTNMRLPPHVGHGKGDKPPFVATENILRFWSRDRRYTQQHSLATRDHKLARTSQTHPSCKRSGLDTRRRVAGLAKGLDPWRKCPEKPMHVMPIGPRQRGATIPRLVLQQLPHVP